MKVSGFSFIRNGIKYDYPFIEAILSIEPLCDEIIVAVGSGDDQTRDKVAELNSKIGNKIKIIDTIWDDSLREGGKVLAKETDKAYSTISVDTDWCIYIQGDEVLHENSIPILKKAMQTELNNSKTEALLVNYNHFYGSYDYVGDSTRWYRREIRVLRRRMDFFSFKDAQGFRARSEKGNRKLNSKLTNATMHHYGWVKDPRAMQKKQETFHKLWHTDQWMQENIPKADAFDYTNIDSLQKFTGTHPEVMKSRINKVNWQFDHDISRNVASTKEKIRRWIEKKTGWRIGEYKNYKLIR
ncbi:MAG: glycosyltransferase family 2 protein [Leptospiraceae bacterium]|nr:glycosyltransferase family 2 protein [Leptospiraceae bacterium]